MQQPKTLLPSTRLSDTDTVFKEQIKKADEEIQAFKKENDILAKQASELKRPQYFDVLEKLQQQISTFEAQLNTLSFNLEAVQQKTNKLSSEIVAVDYLKEKSKPFPFEYFKSVLDELQERYKSLVLQIEQMSNENGDPQLLIPSIKNMFASLEWLEHTYKNLHEHVQLLSTEYDRIKLQHNVMDQGGLHIQEYAHSLTPEKNTMMNQQQPPLAFNTQARPMSQFGGFNQQQPQQNQFGGFNQTQPTQPAFKSGFGQQNTTAGFGQQNTTAGFGQQNTTAGFGQQNTTSGFSGFGQQPATSNQSTGFTFGKR